MKKAQSGGARTAATRRNYPASVAKELHVNRDHWSDGAGAADANRLRTRQLLSGGLALHRFMFPARFGRPHGGGKRADPRRDPLFSGAVWVVIEAPVEGYFEPAEKIDITVPALSLKRIGQHAVQRGESRSRFLVEAAEAAMRRSVPSAG